MKFPSFIRLPNYKRFQFQPRYYDPIKEEIEERTSRIKQELASEEVDPSVYKANISQAFRRKRAYTADRSGLIRFLIFLVLVALFAGYFFYGNDVLYVFILLIPVYFYFRLRNVINRKKRP